MIRDMTFHLGRALNGLLLLTLFLLPLTSWANTITQFNSEVVGSKMQLTFDFSEATIPEIFSLDNPSRLVIDLPNTKESISLNSPTSRNNPIKKIRLGARPNGALRVVLDLKSRVPYTSSQQDKHHLIIRLNSAATQASPKPVVERPKEVLKPTVKPKLVVPKTTPEKVPVKKSPLPQAIITQKPSKPRDIIVAIDAGHGGRDHGAKGNNGTKEKIITFQIANRLAKLINAEPGMQAYLTRDKDVFVHLRTRIKRARKKKSDMFISIHADGFHDKRARGSSVFVLSDRGASSEAAKLIADKENSADLIGGVSLDDKDDMLASVLVDLSQNASLEASYEVAGTILSGLRRIGNVHKKKVESAAFAVLKSPDIPSVLVETAFITNPNEEKKLNSAEHQNKLARAILTGIRTYFRRNPLAHTSPTPDQHIVTPGESLSLIAQRYRISVSALKQANNLSSNTIRIGQRLQIP